MQESIVFVTVGTTRFDRLVDAMFDPALHAALIRQGFKRIVLQHGHSPVPIDLERMNASDGDGMMLPIEMYAFKPSLQTDMDRASLVISHAGSGCILESLSLRRRLIVVVNDTLMDNHQAELAEELEGEGYLLVARPSTLSEVVRDRLPEHPHKPFIRGQGAPAFKALVCQLLKVPSL